MLGVIDFPIGVTRMRSLLGSAQRWYRLAWLCSALLLLPACPSQLPPAKPQAVSGAVSKAGPVALLDNGDGTVTDISNGFVWQKADTEKPVSWQEAKEYCRTLTLGGHSDWRLPTIAELKALHGSLRAVGGSPSDSGLPPLHWNGQADWSSDDSKLEAGAR